MFYCRMYRILLYLMLYKTTDGFFNKNISNISNLLLNHGLRRFSLVVKIEINAFDV